jgi:hypothetical protein
MNIVGAIQELFIGRDELHQFGPDVHADLLEIGGDAGR